MVAKSQPEYKFADELIDAVMEWIGMKWTPSMIRRELREIFPDITFKTCMWLMNKAKKLIRELHGIDPSEYKGSQIAFYETLIRGKKIKIADKLKAAERLDKLFGLESILNVDPAALAEKILEFKRRAAQTVGGKQDDGGNKNDGERENTDDTTNGASKEDNKTISTVEFEDKSIDEDNTTIEEVNKELKLDGEE